MEKFKDIFKNWINEKVDYQLDTIDKISSELDIDANTWFKTQFHRNCGDYSGPGFLDEMLPDFIYYVQTEFEKFLLKYLPPDGKNMYSEPYLNINFDLEYKNSKFYINKKGQRNFKEKIKPLKLNQKLELMENKLFSHIVTQTNLNFYSKTNIRVLKLMKLKN